MRGELSADMSKSGKLNNDVAVSLAIVGCRFVKLAELRGAPARSAIALPP